MVWMPDGQTITLKGEMRTMDIQSQDFVDITTFGDTTRTYLTGPRLFTLTAQMQDWELDAAGNPQPVHPLRR